MIAISTVIRIICYMFTTRGLLQGHISLVTHIVLYQLNYNIMYYKYTCIYNSYDIIFFYLYY